MEKGAPPAPPKTTTTAPPLLGKYQLGPQLGRGSFAKVYRAQSAVDQSMVAIKIIDKNKTVDAAMEPRIIREVDAMRRLQDHPNILKIHEVMATKTKIYLVMELAAGGELFAKVLRRGRLSESAARRYFHQLVNALHFCHQNGIAHRDVKPQNLLLDENGVLKVSDFGLSALPEQLTDGLLHTACGTPAYTAPEVVARRGYDGAKADAWSCGVILFVLLAGCLPFDDSNLVAMYKRIHKRDYQIPDFISKPARSVIMQLLDPNPRTRLSIQTLMETKWFKKSSSLRRAESTESFTSDDGSVKDSDLVPEPKPDMIMNAFSIISLSSGLDLSGLFQTAKKKELKRFTTNESRERVVERVREVGERMGYRLEKMKGGCFRLLKGRKIMDFEVLEFASQLLLVEMTMADGGVDYEESGGSGSGNRGNGFWEQLREGLGDVVRSWHNESL